MADTFEQMAGDVLSENRAKIIDILAEFFQDSFGDDPALVGDWLSQGGTTIDLFVEMVAILRSEYRATRTPQVTRHE